MKRGTVFNTREQRFECPACGATEAPPKMPCPIKVFSRASIAFYRQLGRPFFVMVQHGFPRLVMEVGATRRELERSPITVQLGCKTFRKWSRDLQLFASGSDRKDAA